MNVEPGCEGPLGELGLLLAGTWFRPQLCPSDAQNEDSMALKGPSWERRTRKVSEEEMDDSNTAGKRMGNRLDRKRCEERLPPVNTMTFGRSANVLRFVTSTQFRGWWRDPVLRPLLTALVEELRLLRELKLIVRRRLFARRTPTAEGRQLLRLYDHARKRNPAMDEGTVYGRGFAACAHDGRRWGAGDLRELSRTANGVVPSASAKQRDADAAQDQEVGLISAPAGVSAKDRKARRARRAHEREKRTLERVRSDGEAHSPRILAGAPLEQLEHREEQAMAVSATAVLMAAARDNLDRHDLDLMRREASRRKRADQLGVTEGALRKRERALIGRAILLAPEPVRALLRARAANQRRRA